MKGKCLFNQDWAQTIALYERYRCDVMHFFLSYTHDKMAAEDMVQDLFLKLMEKNEVLLESTAKSYLLVVAKRMIIDDARRKQRYLRICEKMTATMELFDAKTLPQRIEVANVLDLESKIVASMPRRRALVYRLYRYEEFSMDEIAEKLQLSKRTIEAHVYASTHEVRARLRKII